MSSPLDDPKLEKMKIFYEYNHIQCCASLLKQLNFMNFIFIILYFSFFYLYEIKWSIKDNEVENGEHNKNDNYKFNFYWFKMWNY